MKSPEIVKEIVKGLEQETLKATAGFKLAFAEAIIHVGEGNSTTVSQRITRIKEAIEALALVAESEIGVESSVDELKQHLALQRDAIEKLDLLRTTLCSSVDDPALLATQLLCAESLRDKEEVRIRLTSLLDSELKSDTRSPETSWKDCIAKRLSGMSADVRALIEAQQEAFAKQETPKIADPVIKAIPIEEAGEPLVDIATEGHLRISMLPTPATPFASPDCNSGFRASSMVRETVYLKLQKMLEAIDRLAPEYGYSPGTIEIKVFEGVRSLETQQRLFDEKVAEIRVTNPGMTESEIFAEASKWVSPTKDNVPVHSTGGAVDVRLWNSETNDFLDMGKFGVIWGQNVTAPTYSEGLTEEQMNNRLLLLEAAASAGLVNYPYEWWHLSSGDRYASYWLEKNQSQRRAVYGGIQDESAVS
jgi:D-alanyl-D-alanine dipeptidase